MKSGTRGERDQTGKPEFDILDDSHVPAIDLVPPAVGGVPPWVAIYHWINRDLALELRELEVCGYGDAERLQWVASGEDERDFASKADRCRILNVRLEADLLRKLIHGELVGSGIGTVPVQDAPRLQIASDRWRNLKLDLRTGMATGPGMIVLNVLIAEPGASADRKGRRAGPSGTYEEHRAWYRARIEAWPRATRGPSGQKDFQDARERFPGVKRETIRALRLELAPSSWRRGGRQRRPRN